MGSTCLKKAGRLKSVKWEIGQWAFKRARDFEACNSLIRLIALSPLISPFRVAQIRNLKISNDLHPYQPVQSKILKFRI